MKVKIFITSILTGLLLCLTACDSPDLLRYVSEGCPYILVYQYTSEDYFNYYCTIHICDTDLSQPTIVPIENSEEPFWKTIDCGRKGKDVPMLEGYNKNAVDTLYDCDFVTNQVYRLENNCFFFANHILCGGPIDCKIYNITLNDYCNSTRIDTIKCIAEHPYKAVFRIPYKVITGTVGGKVPTFSQIVECINTSINDSLIYNYEAKPYFP